MALRKKYSKKNKKIKNRAHFVLPLVLLFCATLLMVLPLEGPVSSVKALLSYVFIPQIRAAHHAVEYSSDVWDTVVELLNTHQENKHLQEELRQIQLEGAQAKEIAQENQRLSAALKLQGQLPWSGVWAKTTYRDPSQWNSIMIDKGSLDGVKERSAAIAQKTDRPPPPCNGAYRVRSVRLSCGIPSEGSPQSAFVFSDSLPVFGTKRSPDGPPGSAEGQKDLRMVRPDPPKDLFRLLIREI